MSNRRKVLAYAQRLDQIAEEVETNFPSYGLSSRQAQAFVYQIDSLADRMMASHGIDPRYLEEVREALVVEHDADEPHMKTFHSPHDDVVERDGDDEAIQHMDQPFNSFHRPLEDGMGQPGLIHADEDEDMDGDEGKESSVGDWWGEAPSRRASTDYWGGGSRKASRSSRKTDYWGEGSRKASRSDYWGESTDYWS